jgi:uncharacterized membrane protein YjjP (DUF1212 family)
LPEFHVEPDATASKISPQLYRNIILTKEAAVELKELERMYGKWPSFALVAMASMSRLLFSAALVGWGLWKVLK